MLGLLNLRTLTRPTTARVGAQCAEEPFSAATKRVARRLPYGGGMSQKSVEIVIGKLATDEALRTRFRRDPAATLRELSESGLELSQSETRAMLEMPGSLLTVLATWVHPSLQKVAFREEAQEPGGKP